MQDLLAHDMFKHNTVDDIRNLISSDDEQRFSLRERRSTGDLKMRAKTGHTFEVCKKRSFQVRGERV